MLQHLFIAALFSAVHSMESIYEKHSEIADQAASASGYAYQLHSGAPLQLPQGVNHFGYPPITLGRYTQEHHQPLQLPLAQPPALPLNSYGYPAYALNPLPLELAKYSPVAPAAAPEAAPAQVQQSEASKFAQGGGSNFAAGKESSRGEKGESGYKNQHHFDKGAQGKHSKQGDQGYYSQAGGKKADHHEEGQHYSKNAAAAQGANGGSFHDSKSHKKGSKTSGFHRVHHKDEYKKDHTFYDESDNSGHFNKYGSADAKYAGAKGGFAKGGRADSGFEAGAHGAKGYVDKGRYAGQDSGYKGEQGKEAHHKDFQEYAKNGAREAANKHGYAESEGATSYQ